VRAKTTTPKARAFDAAKYRDDPRAIAEYLNDAISTGDPVVITKAIGDMVRAQGVGQNLRRKLHQRDLIQFQNYSRLLPNRKISML